MKVELNVDQIKVLMQVINNTQIRYMDSKVIDDVVRAINTPVKDKPCITDPKDDTK